MHAEINKILVQELDPRDMASGVKALRAPASSRSASSVTNLVLPEQLRWTEFRLGVFVLLSLARASRGASLSRWTPLNMGHPIPS